MPKVTLYVLKAETGKRRVGTSIDLAKHLFSPGSGPKQKRQIQGNFGVLLTESFPDQASNGSMNRNGNQQPRKVEEHYERNQSRLFRFYLEKVNK